jgi:hypothetical protein
MLYVGKGRLEAPLVVLQYVAGTVDASATPIRGSQRGAGRANAGPPTRRRCRWPSVDPPCRAWRPCDHGLLLQPQAATPDSRCYLRISLLSDNKRLLTISRFCVHPGRFASSRWPRTNRARVNWTRVNSTRARILESWQWLVRTLKLSASRRVHCDRRCASLSPLGWGQARDASSRF